MEKINVSKLIIDYTIYPRMTVDSQHVSYMVTSLESGVELPPIVVDKDSKRIVDGVHRVTATKRFSGENSKILVVYKKYANDTDMFIDAMKYNASHGRSLTKYDKTHCILKAEELHIDPEVIASSLNLTTEKLEGLRTERVGKLSTRTSTEKKIAPGKGKKYFAKQGRDLIPLKRTIKEKAGETLTKVQVEANRKLSGMEQSFYVNQVILLVESNLLNRSNEYLIERLEHLYSLLSTQIFTAKKKVRCKQ